MNTNSFSEKMKDPIFKKHVLFSLLYLFISLLILTVGVERINSLTGPALNISQKEEREKAAEIKKKEIEEEEKKKIEEEKKALPGRLKELRDKEASIKPELKIETQKEGTGPTVEIGDTVSVFYKGFNTKGEIFDESRDSKSFDVESVGEAGVITGWNIGLLGTKEGGRYKIFIPSKYAYGETARSERIPANEDLTFEIEILSVKKENNRYKDIKL
ncbi:MAG: FKBP-type peptidyl-prolyl cis-trans isomerase [Patescibacteria group bacterium]